MSSLPVTAEHSGGPTRGRNYSPTLWRPKFLNSKSELRFVLLSACFISCSQVNVSPQVMLIKNMDEYLVNGSLGTVVDFGDPANWTMYPTEDESKKPASSGPGEKKPTSGMTFPVVEFPASRRRLLIQADVWKVELPNGEVQVSRTQVIIISFVLRNLLILMLIIDTFDSVLGYVHSQVTRTNVGQGQS